ncbi:dTDP-4-dehydrorhamnose 3,5-epimerase [Eubacterium maltosivorans]|uniref:dTDP-4-dehydrorhamnose 3,5-epimerase n=1 Tax=Eubacterium maltosivorans TaxID=2041044 RepID=UPI00087EFF5E|nr:dTDP-4-dehydrorhamnose 3,5-epimerase [Eubacterium maltosivorans]WPK80054.1 dTDP-4-dehydrorhamnose 3,5-epimerase [Eubacterium maltosivorans]SDP87455.1 dTDP-4-dehydrorhamnose 3,5-epimerase [Eubacterium maltosivorans]
MQQFLFETTPIQDLMLINPFYMEDERGFFLKSFEKEIFRQNGIKTEIFEDFESYSIKGVIRGLHFQTEKPQAKLVRALTGTIYDVVVDLRKASETFGKWHAEILSADNHKAFFIPKGFAHGFLVLSDSALVSYKCEGAFSKKTDTGIVWNDPELKIDWPLENLAEPIISAKDKNLMTFKNYRNRKNEIQKNYKNKEQFK